MQPLTFEYHTMSENIGLTDANDLRDVLTVKRRASTQFSDLQRRLRVRFLHRRTYMYVTRFLISYIMSRPSCFHTNMSLTRRLQARLRILKDGCLTYEDTSMRNI